MIETTDFRRSEQYTLSIRLTADGFYFALYNPFADKKEKYSRLYQEIDDTTSFYRNLEKIFKKTEWINNKFGKVNVIVDTPRYTLVPLDFFEDEQAEKIFYQNQGQAINEKIIYNVLPQNNIVMIYGIDESTHDFLLQKYPKVTFHSKAGILISSLTSKSQAGNNKKLFIHIDKNSITACAFQNGSLQLCNTFSCQSLTDIIYYTLACWKELALEQETDELHISGTLTEKKELLKILNKYLQQIYVMDNSEYIDLQTLCL